MENKDSRGGHFLYTRSASTFESEGKTFPFTSGSKAMVLDILVSKSTSHTQDLTHSGLPLLLTKEIIELELDLEVQM